ncbi:helix-turn-helix transcriptional regulator [bacterium]|nr:helix-turn-helix transcriptional regulator [bacterium]
MTSDHEAHFFAKRSALGKRLKWWRERRDLKIEAAALQLGVSTSTWGHWETGRTFPSGEMLLALSSLTQLPLQLLFCPHLETCPLHDQVTAEGVSCCQCGRQADADTDFT